MIDSTISMQEINSSNDVRYRTRSNSVESLQSATTRNDKNNNEDWKVTDRNVNNVHTDVNIIGKEQKPISQLESSAEPSLLPNVTEKLERSEKLLTFYQNKVSIISQMLNNLQSQTDLDFTSPSLLEGNCCDSVLPNGSCI